MQCRKKADNLCDLIEFSAYSKFDRVQVICEGFGNVYDEVCFIPANLGKKRDEIKYTYSGNIE
ncbi:MAG: hypothetical protein ACOYWZ_07995 [Bacillota bacterium]